MFDARYLSYFILLHVIIATPQLNLHYTDEASGSESNDYALQHSCLHFAALPDPDISNRQIIYYCISESLPKFRVEKDDLLSTFTFAELSKQNITTQQLYLWSAPIDIIERYQFYLNQLSTSNNLSMETEIYYNCTYPRFGPMCQYELEYQNHKYSTLHEMIKNFYHIYEYKSTNFTCYTHLKCNRTPVSTCLDWTEICDGKIDCLDSGLDEEHCWQLEINECKDDEYRCGNGQCIPHTFFGEETETTDCLDGTDEHMMNGPLRNGCSRLDPSVGCEDVTCTHPVLTSSCMQQRKDLLVETIYSSKDSSISDDCWLAFKCILKIPVSKYAYCDLFCKGSACIKIINNTCPDILYIPNVPILFGDVYFAYTKNDSLSLIGKDSYINPYICSNNSRYDSFSGNVSKILFNNRTCFRPNEFVRIPFWIGLWWVREFHIPLYQTYSTLKSHTVMFNYTSAFCNRSNMYQCAKSAKCISVHRLMNNEYDCPHWDDENMSEINNIDLKKQIQQKLFKCEISNKYIPQNSVSDFYCDCEIIEPRYCEDENMAFNDMIKRISFQTICDGFTELAPVTIGQRNETDETECEQWHCNNIYTRCDDIWNCFNGADEINCHLSLSFDCPSNHHTCASIHTKQLMCLPIQQANDGKIDCIGATDEPKLCSSYDNFNILNSNSYCIQDNFQSCVNSLRICDARKHCIHENDQEFCVNNTYSKLSGICDVFMMNQSSDFAMFLCINSKVTLKRQRIYFSLNVIDNVMKSDKKLIGIDNTMKSHEKSDYSDIIALIETWHQHESRCHRGIDLRVWLSNTKNLTRQTCLCPPSFYGDKCQYQNQRVSLAMKFRAFSDSRRVLFAIIILLIDDSDQRIIHSVEQFTYLSIRDCNIKFQSYLLYSTRPKDPTKHYSIHIDIYEKVSLNYRGSLLFPVNFPFLPVYRLALLIDIPRRTDENTHSCSDNQCVHGKCIRYSNTQETFCQCDQEWTGRYCTVQHTRMCSSDSLNIGVSANNRSICVCPVNTFGYRCLLINTICQNEHNSTCQNDGLCIANDENVVSNQKFVCVCQNVFSGNRCEIPNYELILSFEKDMDLSQSIFIHFIKVIKDGLPQRASTFRTIPIAHNSMTIYWSQPFHLVFIELLNKTYYLALVQKTFNPSTTKLVEPINSSNRCPHISELFNETFVKLHLIRRIKYYHLPCQRQSLNLSCFYDDVHLCLCYNHGDKRLANCFDFDHNMTFDCSGQSVCENQGQCFQDASVCPQRSMCVCRPCYYGTRCHFSTSGFSLSLDAILGYHIRSNLNFIHQPTIIKTSLALTIMFIMAGLINGIFALITFKDKTVHEVGCGLYLLGSSITTLLIMIMLGLKFSMLILAQMTLISNRSFLSFQCHSIDFLLQVCLCMDQWLNACVATERAVTVIKGIRFVKKKSKQAAKMVIIILLVFTISTSIHDPIYRRLIDEENEDEKRIWCIVTYPSNLQVFNSIMQIFHVFAPFMINLISAIILIKMKSRQQSTIQTHRTYKELLREQFQQYKHLFTAPLLLVILALPRLIIAFVSKCMKSANDSWLFLAGYFISFIPCMLTFVVFILPSKFYKKVFTKSVARYQTNMRRRLYLISSE